MEWLFMPWVLLRPMILALPAIKASDAIYWSTVNLVGSNAMDKRDRRSILNRWQREARQGHRAVARPTGPAAALAAFQNLGIKTEVIPRND